MGRSDPTVSHCYRAGVDAGDAELLEALDTAHDVYQGVPRPNFVQGDVVGWQPVHFPLGLTQQLERLDRPFPHPGRKTGPPDHRDEIADVPVGVGSVVVMVVIVVVRMRGRVGRLRLVQGLSREADRDFRAADTTSLDFFDAN
jgi:hypothetical protein